MESQAIVESIESSSQIYVTVNGWTLTYYSQEILGQPSLDKILLTYEKDGVTRDFWHRIDGHFEIYDNTPEMPEVFRGEAQGLTSALDLLTAMCERVAPI